jgi:uncharacterized iron-regulated membrane protein
MATGYLDVEQVPQPRPGSRLAISRQFWVVAHRWAGLSLALFLAVAGFTGIFLSWIDELEVATAPELHLSSPPSPNAEPMDVLTLRDQVLARYPDASVDFVPLEIEPGRNLRLHLHWIDPKTGLEREDGPGWDDLFIDPYTGEERGRREWGDIGQGVKNLMPFVYRLHYSFALGDWAMLVFGIAALVWVLDCFVGFYLTLPTRTRRRSGAPPAINRQSWFARWKPSWLIRWKASRYKLNFDLHRAGGLWLWPILLVFAWSSVSFNLPQVYVPVMKQFGAEDARETYLAALLPAARHDPRLNFQQALERGKTLAREESARAGLALRPEGETYLWHVPEAGSYVYGFTTSADISKHGMGTSVVFDSNTGKLTSVQIPTGVNAANTVTTWISALHTAHVGGLPWRIAVSVIGALVTMLTVTGIVIWMRKRGGRISRGLRAN